MGAEAGVQVIGAEVLLHAVVADNLLPVGEAGALVARRGDVVCTDTQVDLDDGRAPMSDLPVRECGKERPSLERSLLRRMRWLAAMLWSTRNRKMRRAVSVDSLMVKLLAMPLAEHKCGSR